MRRLILKVVYLLFLLEVSKIAFADESSQTNVEIENHNNSLSIDVNSNDSAESQDNSFFSAPIEQFLRNPAVVSGLASGAEALNSSVESLMDALFYGLLDHKIEIPIRKNWTFGFGVQRDLFSVPDGSYVVIDSVRLGPSFSKELWRAHDVPVSLGVDGAVEVLEIYRRTDGMRVFEQESRPKWRMWVNNWFGILPFLTSILPPSFNQNEMYDPVRVIEGPLSVPLNRDIFFAMPVGSIRSYGLSGGVSLPIVLGELFPDELENNLKRAGDLKHYLPYTIFKRGEHRINVLRRDENIAWVGVKRIERAGHSLSPLVGNKADILTGALGLQLLKFNWTWQGVPLALFPVDWKFEQALSMIYDQVYEFDMRNILARDAYELAARGDFTLASSLHFQRSVQGKDTGVKFHFVRSQNRTESSLQNRANLGVFSKNLIRERFSGEVQVTDGQGKFFVLEAQHDASQHTWNILIGDEETRYQSLVKLNVKKVRNKQNPDDVEETVYLVDPAREPLSVAISMGINDRFVDAEEYKNYIDQLRFFLKMTIKDVPQIPMFDPKRIAFLKRRNFFSEPRDDIWRLHITPQHIGGFGAFASINFSNMQIEKIKSQSEDSMWGSFAKAFGENEGLWKDSSSRNSLSNQLNWFKVFFFLPARLLQIRSPKLDFIAEADNAIRQLRKLRDAKEPLEQLALFYQLFDTDYMLQYAHALLELAGSETVPRSVRFAVQAKGTADRSVKDLYRTLNNKVFHAGLPLPVADRYQQALEKMGAFYLDQPRDVDDKPRVSRILVTSRAVPDSLRALPYSEGIASIDRNNHVMISFECRNLTQHKSLKVFVRVEQAGKVKLGKLHLAEKVIHLTPIEGEGEASSELLRYEFFLTGPLSPISNYIFEDSVRDGDDLSVTIAVSSDGVVWSAEHQFEFSFKDGVLSKPK